MNIKRIETKMVSDGYTGLAERLFMEDFSKGHSFK